MPETFTIFAPQTDLVPLDELLELTGNDDITPLGSAEAPLGYTAVWHDVQVTIQRLSDEPAQQRFDALQQFVEQHLDGRTDSKALKHLRRLESIQQILSVVISPEADPVGKAKGLILGIVTFYEGGFFWADGALYNEAGKRFFGREDTRPRYFKESIPDESEEATLRKERTLARLNREKVPYIKHLPVIADASQSHQRPVEMLVQRFIALVLIADKAEGDSVARYEERVRQYGLEQSVSADERAYAHTEKPIQQDTIKFSQRYESAWTIAWALGMVETLPRPDVFCDVDQLHEWVAKHTVESLVKLAKPRALSVLLDETDLMYRYHWAVNDAELYGTRIPGKLIPAVTYERHYALNWMIGQDEWDKVPTDT